VDLGRELPLAGVTIEAPRGPERIRRQVPGRVDDPVNIPEGLPRGPDGPELVAAYGEYIIPEIAAW